MTLGYDPRLKAAMGEMEDVAKRYDVAMVMLLVSPSHGEVQLHMPTWSPLQARPTDDGTGRQALHMHMNRNEHVNEVSFLARAGAGVHIVESVLRFINHFGGPFQEVWNYLNREWDIKPNQAEFRPTQPEDREQAEKYIQKKGYWDR